jgi:predicted small lipoprotein YifL
LKRGRVLPCIIFGVILLALLACGMKGPPFLPEKSMPFKVKQMTGEWKDGVVYLKGHVVPRNDDDGNAPDVLGCTVYHVQYDLENPPCEGCPIEYGILEERKADVITEDKFHCQFPRIKTKGIHFFKVCLLGPKGTLGPSSNGVKILIDD